MSGSSDESHVDNAHSVFGHDVADESNTIVDSAVVVVRDLADRAFGAVLPLIDIEQLFLRALTPLEVSSLCCIFPNVREHFMASRSVIGTFPRSLDVVSLFNRIPDSEELKPMLKTFNPHTVIIPFGKSDRAFYNVLAAFDPLKPFYSLEIKFDYNDLVLVPGQYHVHLLTIHQNRWNPAREAVRVSLNSVRDVKEIVLNGGMFDVVMAAHLEHVSFTSLELRGISVSQFEIPQIVNWLVTRAHLTDLRIIDYPYWVQPTDDVLFFRKLLSRISSSRNLRSFEFSIGGRFMNLGGLLRLEKLRKLRINVEIHLEHSLEFHLFRILRLLKLEDVTIGFYCSRDWSCIHRQSSGREFIAQMKGRFSAFGYVSCDGLDAPDLALI